MITDNELIKYIELLDFLERDDIDVEEMQNTTDLYLNTFSFKSDITKTEYRKLVKDYIIKFANNMEKPLFLTSEDSQ
jgi:hypothetical protein